jgi:hypothetical protein
MSAVQDLAKLKCTICTRRKKGFKSRAGLQRHETLKHSTYNILPPHIQPVSDSELLHLKKAIIKELQKRLKNHHNAVGEQFFSIYCSENSFVGIFKTHITRYSPCGSFYFCRFSGENAFDEIGEILSDKNWGVRNYGQGQLSFVRLHISEEFENSDHKQKTKKAKQKLLANGGMTVEWKVSGGKDKENHIFEAGSAKFRFFLDQCQI